MRNWLLRNSDVVQALGALATAVAAVTALVVVPWQIGEADRIQREQTAREIYREFLNLTVQKPELAVADHCLMTVPKDLAAYEAYVDYLLYTAEQMLSVSAEWREPMAAHLEAHHGYLCSISDWSVYTDEVADLVRTTTGDCSSVRICEVSR